MQSQEIHTLNELLEVTVEGLRDDDLPRPRQPGKGVILEFNAAQGFRYLLEHGVAAREYLVAGVKGEDAQQRFLAACLLGMHGLRDELARTTAVLLLHLEDNDVPCDACMSAAALFRLGPQERHNEQDRQTETTKQAAGIHPSNKYTPF